MSAIKQYLAKQKDFSKKIKESPSKRLSLQVVIPAYKEISLENTLSSLRRCKPPKGDAEIIVLINGSAKDDKACRKINLQAYESCLLQKKLFTNPKIKLYVLCDLDLPSKKAGVGLARKLLMDEACSRFDEIGENRGVIVNLDADCEVAENYLVEIEEWFLENDKLEAASINFEHHIDSKYILQYELHLRYFIGIQREIGLPFAFQTVGSAMACRALAYAKVGGMNTRKAGEDFYFLHKFIKNGSCGNIFGTTVYPSARVSDRVPFGTGRAIGEMKEGKDFRTYNFASFILISRFVQQVEKYYKGEQVELDIALVSYLAIVGFEERLIEIRSNTSSYEAYRKRFFQFFDAFQLMKCLHYLRDHGYEDQSLESVLPDYCNLIGTEFSRDMLSNLKFLREYDKS